MVRILSLLIAAFSLVGCVSAQLPTPTSKVFTDVVYFKSGGAAFTMDISVPAKPTGIGVLWIHSGGWVSNHSNINPEIGKYFSDNGITLFQVVHGTSPRFKVPDIMPMVTRAVRFARANAATYGVDPKKIGITGASAGGHLSLMAAAKGDDGIADSSDPLERASSRLNSVAVFFPPTDMSNYGKAGVETFSVPSLRIFWPAMGVDASMPVEKLKELAFNYSPINFVTAKMPPTMLIHGDKDFLVPIQQSEILIEKLKSVSVKSRLILKAGKGHGWPDMGPDMASLISWFKETLGR